MKHAEYVISKIWFKHGDFNQGYNEEKTYVSSAQGIRLCMNRLSL